MMPSMVPSMTVPLPGVPTMPLTFTPEQYQAAVFHRLAAQAAADAIPRIPFDWPGAGNHGQVNVNQDSGKDPLISIYMFEKRMC